MSAARVGVGHGEHLVLARQHEAEEGSQFDSGVPYPNFWRLEAFGSPRIGWERVVIDSVAGKIVSVEPRKMKRWGK